MLFAKHPNLFQICNHISVGLVLNAEKSRFLGLFEHFLIFEFHEIQIVNWTARVKHFLQTAKIGKKISKIMHKTNPKLTNDFVLSPRHWPSTSA